MTHTASSILWIGVISLAACSWQADQPTGDMKPGTYLNHDPSVGYTGNEGCKDCHPDRYATYMESQMGRSFRPALLQNSDASWERPNRIYDRERDLYYFPFAQGDSLYIREYRLSGRDTVFQRVERIDHIVGSGQHTNSHMMEINGYFYQMPLTFYTQERRWDLPPGFRNYNHRFGREIHIECMTCHNAIPGYVAGSDNRYDWVRHGIDCERCHGPGELHDETIRKGIVVDTRTETDWTIVNPKKLSSELQYDICRRCHLQGVAVLRDGMSFLDFRPGMLLTDVINTFMPRYTDSLSQFIMASHPDRMNMSACWKASVEADSTYESFTCVTCHDPHVPIDSLGPDGYNNICRNCHVPAVSGCSEDESVRVKINDDCTTCHMPTSSTWDVPHVRITDHFIRKPDPKPDTATERKKEFVRLASLTEPDPSNKLMADAYLTYYEQFNTIPRYLDSAEVYMDRAREEESPGSIASSLIRLLFLQDKYEQIARLADEISFAAADDGWTHYRLGEAFVRIGKPETAVSFFERAVDLGPDHLWFRTKLAGAYISTERIGEGIAILNQVLADNPKFHPAYNNRGYANVLSGRLDAAEEDFHAAISLDPDSKQPLANLASLYLNRGQSDRGIGYARRLTTLEPDNSQYQTLLDALSEGG
jgi:tetratricopeptide (TPR) repeat protein